MIRKGLMLLAGLVSLSGSQYLDHDHNKVCDNFMEENGLFIPATAKSTNGITEEVFHAVLDRVEEVYGPIIAEDFNAELSINRDWDNGTVNAYASRSGNKYIIKMFGGLARHETVTPLGFAAVACHETGHHIGGAPRYSRNTSWASTEGQSDYFAMLKCLRRFMDGLTDEQREMFQMVDLEVDPFGKEKCDANFEDEVGREFCYQGTMAGQSLANLLSSLRNPDPATFPKLDTPSDAVVDSTYERHPQAQCRLDTYFNGALCAVDVDIDVDASDANVGSCVRAAGHVDGVRPLCWYKPAE